MDQATTKKYNAVLKLFTNFQAKAVAAKATVFIDGAPAYNQNPFFFYDELEIGVTLGENSYEYFFDGLMWNDTFTNIKKDFKSRFTLWKQVR